MASRGAWNSFNQGLQSGYQLGEKYQQAKEREDIQRIMNEQGTDVQGNYDNYNASIKAEDEATFGSSGLDDVNAGKKGLGYRVAGQTFSEKPSEGEAYAAKMGKVSDYYMGKGDIQKAVTAKEHGVRSAEMAREMDRRKKIDAIDKEFEQYYKNPNPVEAARKLFPEYNVDSSGFDDNHFIAEASRPGGSSVVSIINKDTGKVVAAKEFTPEVARQLIDRAYLMRMKAAGGESRRFAMEQENKDRTFGLQERGVAVQERGADTQEGLRRMQGEELAERIRTGNWGQLKANEALANYRNSPPNARAARDPLQEELIKKYAEEAAATPAEGIPALQRKYRKLGLTALGPTLAERIIGAETEKAKAEGTGEGNGNQSDPPPAAKTEAQIAGDPAMATPSRGLGGGESYAERREAAIAAARKVEAVKASPEYRDLEAQRRAALRANNPTAANAIMVKQRNLILAE